MMNPQIEARFIHKIERVQNEHTIRNVEDAFDIIRQLGQGTYGQVYLAVDKVTGEEVALKKIKLEAAKEKREGFPITAIREIRVLMTLQHKNVVQLKEIVRSNILKGNDFKGSIYLVFEYMQHDLSGLHERMGKAMDPAMAKSFIAQTLEGLAYCHAASVLHRDIKASNLLVDNDGVLKLADFGLARPHITGDSNPDQLTFQVCTLWYRPPELFLGSQSYGGEVDVWSTGCILFELLAGVPLFAAKKDVDVMEAIWHRLGHPTPEVWPGAQKLQFYHYVKMSPPKRVNSLRSHCESHGLPPDAIDLLEGMLQLDPARRPTARQCLDHPYFAAYPPPMSVEQFREYGFEASHEFIVKGKAKRGRPQSGEAGDGEHDATRRREVPPQHASKAHPPADVPPPLAAAMHLPHHTQPPPMPTAHVQALARSHAPAHGHAPYGRGPHPPPAGPSGQAAANGPRPPMHAHDFAGPGMGVGGGRMPPGGAPPPGEPGAMRAMDARYGDRTGMLASRAVPPGTNMPRGIGAPPHGKPGGPLQPPGYPGNGGSGGWQQQQQQQRRW